ncbi:MAG: DUF7305 domain-containing protein [Phycisphaerae bacterium]
MKRNSLRNGQRRGIALLLVMIGLVVCTLLTAGFLSTQGTSIAIARNERDAEQCRMLAQAGIDLSFAQIRALDAARTTADKPGWREKMSPGTWLSNFAIGNGSVTVTAHSAGATDSFTADYHQPIILTSTGFANNRQFTLTATISPTGGGEVFRGGNYFASTVVIGSGGLPLLAPAAIVDSYNSSSGPYSTSGTKAVVWTNSTAGGSVTVNTNSILDGSVLAGPNSLLSSVVNLLGMLLGGNSSVAAASETRDPGVVIPPNVSGLTAMGGFSGSSGSPPPGSYGNFTVGSHFPATTVFLGSGTYYVNGNFVVGSSAKATINGNTVMYVTGNMNMGTSGSIVLTNGSTLTLYVGGNININGGQINTSGTNPLPGSVQILGLPSTGNIQITNASKVVSVIYSPSSSVTMQTGSPVVQGAVVAHDMTLLNTAQFHYDEATKNVKISNIAGGTAPPGTADYTISVK